ncbi:MAG: autotransporter outer membrane beta-barrel domain-containing protein [Chlorobiaceae bacterium]|nr:autotransporter outer membrane beta-barrel domain-containing protein [Chlorobiaceae bacterium]
MRKKGRLLLLYVALSAVFGLSTPARADITYTPITPTVSTIQSPYLYVSVNNTGTLGNGYANPGIQHDPTGTGSFSDGKDYLTPGDPFEGFYINVVSGGSTYTALGNNNDGDTGFSTTGTLANFSTTHNADVLWTGTNTASGMTVASRYTFSDASQYIKIRTTLSAAQALTGVQFLRILDPDQDSSTDLGSSRTSSTSNTLGFTTSTGRVIPASDAAVGAGAVRPDLKVTIYTNSAVPHAAGISSGWNTNPSAYLGSTPLNDGNGDNTIGIAYQVGDMAAGTSTELVYYYLFTDSAEVLDDLITEIISGNVSWQRYLIDHAGNQNAQSVGGVLDTLTAADALGQTNATQQSLIDNFAASDPAGYVTLATALSGEIHAAVAAEMPLSSIWLQNTVSDVLFKSSSSETCPPAERGVWVSIGRNWDRWYGDSRASGIQADRNQFAFGYDLESNKQYRVGVGGLYADINVDGANESKGNASKLLAFAYGQYDLGSVLVDGIIGAGSSRLETSRSVTLNGATDELSTAKSGFSGLAGLTVSVPMAVKGFSVQPYASALLIHEERGATTEGDAVTALTLPHDTMNGSRLSVGVSLASACRNPVKSAATFKLNLEGGVDSSELANPHVKAKLAGTQYNIVSPSVSRGYFQAKAEGTVRVAKNSYCYADYISTFRSGAQSQGVELGVKFIF